MVLLSIAFPGVWTVSRNMSRLIAVEAESFLQVLSSFFVGHCIDGGGHAVNVHSVGIVSLLGLIISSLISWSRGISSSVDLSKFVGGETLLSSCRFARLVIIKDLSVVLMDSVELD